MIYNRMHAHINQEGCGTIGYIWVGYYILPICISYAPFIGISFELMYNLTFVGENEIYNINSYSIVLFQIVMMLNKIFSVLSPL
jgi:hypothetical protein